MCSSLRLIQYIVNKQHSELEITLTKDKKEKPAADKLQFGKYFSDHMLEVEWDQESGWGKPRIVPFHNLELSPSCTVFHYALECFEGLKAYYDTKGGDRTLLFRPDMNAKRMATSCARLGLPVRRHRPPVFVLLLNAWCVSF